MSSNENDNVLNSIWGASPEVCSQKVCELVVKGMNDAANVFEEKIHAETGTAAKDEVEAFFREIQPQMTKKLGELMGYAQRNVFGVPEGIDVSQIARHLNSFDQSANQHKLNDLDNQISNLRDKIVMCDEVETTWILQKKRAEEQMKAVNAVAADRLRNSDESAKKAIHNIVTAAEHFNKDADMLESQRGVAENDLVVAASNAAAKVKSRHCISSSFAVGGRNDSASLGYDDEHAPLNDFVPSAGKVLDIARTDEARNEQLKEFSILNAHLLG